MAITKKSIFERIKIGDVIFSNTINEIKNYKPKNRNEYLKLLNAHFNLKIVPDFPIKVTLETSSACNYDCGMCPRIHMKRSKVSMDLELAKKVIDECAKNNVYYMAFQRHGEPLMNVNTIEILKYAKEKKIPVRTIITNGSLLNENKARELLSKGQPSSIIISFDGITEDEYKKLRRNDKYSLVKKNIKKLYQLKKELKSEVFLQINALTLENNEENNNKFKEEFSFIDNIDITTPKALAGTKSDLIEKTEKIPETACKQLWMHLIVLSDGTVTLCCPDVNGELKVGNAKKTSLKEMWNEKIANNYRNLHINNERNKIPLCSKCQNECIPLGYY